MIDKFFEAAIASTLQHEGIYSADEMDPGGQTYMGISRVYWPQWPGWILIDQRSAGGGDVLDLSAEVMAFYHDNFWLRVQGDKIAALSTAIANELFDTAVNLGVSIAVQCFQTALNMQNHGHSIYADLQVDGRPGPKTIDALRLCLAQQGGKKNNEKILLNCMNGEQYICYKNNPKHEYFRGWFARL